MQVVLFRINTRADIDEESYGQEFERMLSIAKDYPGFVGIEGFQGEDGSELAVASFENEAAITAWRNDAEHLATQHRGRDEFFDSYSITVATVDRHYEWHR